MVRDKCNNRISMYKRRGDGSSDIEARRKRMAADRREERAKKRTDTFAARRGIHDNGQDVNSREKKLEEFKKKKTEMSAKTEISKKPFVMSKVTYNDSYLYKPFESSVFKVPKGVVPVQFIQPQRSLRSHARNLQNKPTKTIQEAISDFTSAITSATTKNMIKLPITKMDKSISEKLNRTFDGSCCPDPTKVESNISENPMQRSPNNFEKFERKGSPEIKKLTSILGTNKLTKMVCSDSENLSKQSCEEKTAENFRTLHTQAVTELNRLSEYWFLQQAPELPSLIRDEINVAVGNAKLLISQKLQQFRNLISEHENLCTTTELKVLSSDLDGFWNMVNNQVEDVYNKFKRLETLKQNNWQELIEVFQPVKQTSKHVQKSKISKAKGTSGLRSFLAQARNRVKICKDENSNPSVDIFTHEAVGRSRPMSPVVMRVTAQAKFLGSPKIQITPYDEAKTPPHNSHVGDIPIVNLVRSPLQIIDSGIIIPIMQTSQSTKTTSARRLMSSSPGSTPLRRSIRILGNKTKEPL